MTMPRPDHPLIIAHRGASASAPENTLSAFALAVAQDADGIEVDVRRTADGVLVLHHDPALPDGRPISELTHEELGDGAPDVPTLDDMLPVTGDLLINVEIKNEPSEPGFDESRTVADAVVSWVRHHGIQPRIVITSFDGAAVDRVRELDPAITTGRLVGKVADLTATMIDVAAAGHRWLVPHYAALDLDPSGLIGIGHAQGLRLMVATLDQPERMQAMADAGIDGVITDDPALAYATLS